MVTSSSRGLVEFDPTSPDNETQMTNVFLDLALGIVEEDLSVFESHLSASLQYWGYFCDASGPTEPVNKATEIGYLKTLFSEQIAAAIYPTALFATCNFVVAVSTIQQQYLDGQANYMDVNVLELRGNGDYNVTKWGEFDQVFT